MAMVLPGRPGRRIVAVFTAIGVLGLLFLPAEHIHAGDAPDGHHAEVIHRHFDPHHSPAQGVAFEHGDDHDDVQWLSLAFVNPHRIPHVYPAAQVAHKLLSACLPPLTFHGSVEDVFASAHDPPWQTHTGLRGPPSPSL
jgi:hypothetical protein